MSDQQQSSAIKAVRQAGVAVPVVSLRRDGDLGIGDVVALREFVDWCADLQIGFVQLLPINETGSDNSPYNAISSVALEPMTLDCSFGKAALEDLTETVYDEVIAAAGVDALRRGSIDYERVRALKLDLLWRAFLGFLENHCQQGTDRDEEFHSFCEAEADWLGDYCLFRLLMDMEGGNQNWQTWSEDYREIGAAKKFLNHLLKAEPVKTERQLMYYAYVQWVAFQQWRAVRKHADERGVALMGDVPIGVSFCSADVFANPTIFDLDWYGGAPPETNFKDDEFTMKWGQNWGIPLYRWDVMEAKDDFAWWRRRVRKVCEIFSMFRVDHALGFYRIYAFPWNPVRNGEFLPLSEEEAAERNGGRRPGFKERPDNSEENCAANCRDGEKYLRVLSEAAGGAEVIAEDLGVVPDYVRPNLELLGIPGMKVPHWEYDSETGQVIKGDDYTEVSFATWATHDHDPLRVQWQQHREVLRAAASNPPAEDDHDAQGDLHTARSFMAAMNRFAGIDTGDSPEQVPPYGDGVRESLLASLLASNSRHAGIMITDVLGLEDRINVPGILGENWVWRMESSVDDLRNNPHWRYLGEQFTKLLLESGRISNFTRCSPSVPASVGQAD